MPAEGRENPLLKKGNSDAFFREKYLTKNNPTVLQVHLKALHLFPHFSLLFELFCLTSQRHLQLRLIYGYLSLLIS